MQTLRIQQKNKKYLVYDEDFYIGPVYFNEFLKANIDAGSFKSAGSSDIYVEVTEEQLNVLKELVLDKAYRKGAMLAGRVESCQKEIRYKLGRADFPNYAIDEAIIQLYADKYLDDHRYMEIYVRTFARTKSRELIGRELRMKDIDTTGLDEILDEYYEEEELDIESLIKNLVEKKYGKYDLKDEKIKRRAMEFLFRKGFNTSDIMRYFDNL